MTFPVNAPPASAAGVDVVASMLQAVLDAISQTFTMADVELPARQYIHFGGTAADCEQLTVQFDQLYLGIPGGDPNAMQQCNGPRTVAMTVQLWRKAPALSRTGAPSAKELTAGAVGSSRDAWLLIESLGVINVEAGWGVGVIAEVSALEPQGGFKGLSMSLVVPVP